MSLCPEADKRAAMSDDEFWAHVFPSTQPEDDLPDEAYSSDSDTQWRCNVCGEFGACGYDAEGRPLIHVDEETDDE